MLLVRLNVPNNTCIISMTDERTRLTAGFFYWPAAGYGNRYRHITRQQMHVKNHRSGRSLMENKGDRRGGN